MATISMLCQIFHEENNVLGRVPWYQKENIDSYSNRYNFY